MDPVWIAEVVHFEDANPFLDYVDQKEFNIYLGRFARNEKVEVIVRKVQKKSSLAQNRYYYGVICKLLSDDTGHSVDEIDCILKWKFLKRTDEKGMEYVPSKMDLTTRQREEFHKACREWADIVLRVKIPLPNEVDTGE